MKQKVFINISEESLGMNVPQTYIQSYQNLYKEYNIITHTYYIGKGQDNIRSPFHLRFCCEDEAELFQLISKVYSDNEVVFINTFTEGLISLCNSIKEKLGEPITKHASSFRDKTLQREFLQAYNPELGIKYMSFKFENINKTEIESYLGFPFIVKPSSGIQSAGVAVISSQKDLEKYLNEYQSFLDKFRARGFDNNTLLFEEFIDGDMYSIDYFVDKQGKLISTMPVEVKLGTDIHIDDFMNFVRSFREEATKKIDSPGLTTFVNGVVQALGIRNTFIHHEFKITSKGKLKTIEVNGRIGGYRLEMIQEAFEYNWLSPTIGEKPQENIIDNFSSFLVYPIERGILQGFNEALFKDISQLPSIYTIRKLDSFIGQEIGLTKEGFTKVAIIKIKNSDSIQFEKDYQFIESNYKSLLIIK